MQINAKLVDISIQLCHTSCIESHARFHIMVARTSIDKKELQLLKSKELLLDNLVTKLLAVQAGEIVALNFPSQRVDMTLNGANNTITKWL